MGNKTKIHCRCHRASVKTLVKTRRNKIVMFYPKHLILMKWRFEASIVFDSCQWHPSLIGDFVWRPSRNPDNLPHSLWQQKMKKWHGAHCLVGWGGCVVVALRLRERILLKNDAVSSTKHTHTSCRRLGFFLHIELSHFSQSRTVVLHFSGSGARWYGTAHHQQMQLRMKWQTTCHAAWL